MSSRLTPPVLIAAITILFTITLAVPAAAELEAEPYGAVQYRFRERVHTVSDQSDSSNTTADYFNLFSWRAGLRVKANGQLSLQLQIGNDWNSGDNINWRANNMPRARVESQNLYVHIASFKWDPGLLYIEGGVVALNSNGTLDLLERSINFGNYGGAGFYGWTSVANSSMLGIRLGAPIIKGDVKFGVELFQTVMQEREQSRGARGEPDPNPAAVMLLFTSPVEAIGGTLKVTPEFTMVINRNYNSALEAGDDEMLCGLSASCKINDAATVNLSGGYGVVNNGKTERIESNLYDNAGLLACAGAAVKAGPGTLQIDFKYNSSENKYRQRSKIDYLYTDLRYGWEVYDKFTIMPRYRNYMTLHPKSNVGSVVKMEMENRFELFLEGSF
jgi:hypothetical protein